MTAILRKQLLTVLLLLWGTARAGVPGAGPTQAPGSEGPHVRWRRSYPWASALGSEVKSAPDGSLYLLSRGQPPAEPESPRQLARLSQDGRVEWRRPVAPTVFDLELDAKGRLVLSGAGRAGVHVVALDADGTPRWGHHFTLPGLDVRAPRVSVEPDGSILLAGEGVDLARHVSNAYVRKLHPSGALGWSTAIELGPDAYVDAVSSDGAGNVWLLGSRFASIPGLELTGSAPFIAALSGAGDVRWLRWLPPGAYGEALVGSRSEGAFFAASGPLVGKKEVPGTRVFSVAPDGTVRWTRRLASREGVDRVRRLTALPDGGVRAHIESSYGEEWPECPEDVGYEGRQPDFDTCRVKGEGPSLFVLDLEGAGSPGRVSHFGHRPDGAPYWSVLPAPTGCLVVHDYPLGRCGMPDLIAQQEGIILPTPVPVLLGPRLRMECPTWTSTADATRELSVREDAPPQFSDTPPPP
jgi:hypothetical protein